MEVKENKLSKAIVEISRILRDSEGRPIALKLTRGITSKRKTIIGIPKLSESGYQTFKKIYDSSLEGVFKIVYFRNTFILYSIKSVVNKTLPSSTFTLVTPKPSSFTLGQAIDYFHKKSRELKSTESLCFVILEDTKWKILSVDQKKIYISGLNLSSLISLLYALDNINVVVKENETITKEAFILGLESPSSFYISVK